MKDNIRLALSSLRANLMRTMLTMLGIVIGIASVISILTIADAMKGQMNAMYASLGMSNVNVSFSSKDNTDPDLNNLSVKQSTTSSSTDGTADTGMMDSKQAANQFTVEQLEGLRHYLGDQIVGISYTTDAMSGMLGQTSTSVVGISSSYPNVKGMEAVEVTAGRWISDNDEAQQKNVCVIRTDMALSMFGGDQAALGKTIQVDITKPIKTLEFTIIGVYKGKASADGGIMGGGVIDFSQYMSGKVYTPVSVAIKINGAQGVNGADIGGVDGIDTDKLAQEAKDYLNGVYQSDIYNITVQAPSTADLGGDTMQALQMAFGAVAAISLLVGGIGVMNIMMVSITERTKEIGIRKALGAKRATIRNQFITESMVICMIGGIIGVLLGIGIGWGISTYIMGFSSFPSLFSILLSVGFSLLIGIFFGYYPANKAAKLRPLDALRYE